MDTTVILAQPRVSRLRAAVIYVDDRAPGAAADILDFQMPVWRGPPLFLVSLYCSNNKKETYRELRSGRPKSKATYREERCKEFPSKSDTYLPHPNPTQNGVPPLFWFTII